MDIVKPPQKKVLPDILTVKEIERVINGTRELRYQTFILTAYSMGLRLGETLNLTIGDIDGDRMKVHVRQAKGKKDRFVTLPEASLMALRCYWLTHLNPKFLFPAGKTAALRHVAKLTMDRGGLQKTFKVIVNDCGISKHVTPHSLRHYVLQDIGVIPSLHICWRGVPTFVQCKNNWVTRMLELRKSIPTCSIGLGGQCAAR